MTSAGFNPRMRKTACPVVWTYYYPQVEAVLTPGFRLEQLDVRLHELLDDLSYLGVVGDHLANLGQLLLAHIDGSRLLLSILIGQAVCLPGG